MSGVVIGLADASATEALGRRLAGLVVAGDVVLLEGVLGAGKTTLVRALLRAACGDAALEVPSPTYTLVQTYDTPGGLTLHHYDLWRLAGPEGLAELGWDDAQDGVVLVEWPDRLGGLRPAEALEVTLELVADGRRARLHGWEGRLG